MWPSGGSSAGRLSLCSVRDSTQHTVGSVFSRSLLFWCQCRYSLYYTHARQIIINTTHNSLQHQLNQTPHQHSSPATLALLSPWILQPALVVALPFEMGCARGSSCWKAALFFWIPFSLWFIFKRYFFFKICIRIRSCANFSGDQFARLFSRKTYSLACMLVWYGNP